MTKAINNLDPADAFEVKNESTVMIDSIKVLVRWVSGVPGTIHGAVSKQSDYLYWVFINADLEEWEREEALEHELRHIERKDHNKVESVKNSLDDVRIVRQQIENEVHEEMREWRRENGRQN